MLLLSIIGSFAFGDVFFLETKILLGVCHLAHGTMKRPFFVTLLEKNAVFQKKIVTISLRLYFRLCAPLIIGLLA